MALHTLSKISVSLLTAFVLFSIFLSGIGSANTITVDDLTDSVTAADLVNALLGENSTVVVSNITVTGSNEAIGMFTNGDELGFDTGVVMSSGVVADVPEDMNYGADTNNGELGDDDLSTLVDDDTFDAIVLEFDFVPDKSSLAFNYRFGSEEDFLDEYDDAFGLFVNGENVALLPDGNPVSIFNIREGPYYQEGPLNNCFDGFSIALTANAQVNTGTLNHMKFAIADMGDEVVDAVVFIEGDSFVSTTSPNVPTSPLCEGETNPADITDMTPEFSWTFSDPDENDTQGAYQIQVGTSEGGSEMWDSGQVDSSSSTNIVYAGSNLNYDTTYYWRVKTWDNNNAVSSYCAAQNFSTAEEVITLAAAFTSNVTSGTAPLTVGFTDESTGSPTNWAWYFGDEDLSGAWTEMASGATWSGRRDHSSVLLPDGSIVLMGGNDGDSYKNDVWRSTDNGTTWMLVNSSAGWSARYGHSSVALPDGSIVLMGGYDGSYKNDIWCSTDNGATWTELNSSAGWSARRYHSSVVLPDGSIVLMGGYDTNNYKNDVWRSTDNGTTWTEVNSSAGWSARYSHASVVLSDGSIVLMGGNDDSNKNDIWRSTDSGATWTELNSSAGWSARRYHSTVVLPDGSIMLMGGRDINGFKNDVWRSTDNGTTWTELNSSAGWSARYSHASVVLSDGSIVLMGGYDDNNYMKNDVWCSVDNGTTWTESVSNTIWSARYGHSSVVLLDGSIVLMGGDDGDYKNDVWCSVDNGTTWTELNSSAGWSARRYHSTVVLPDGSIVLMGGYYNEDDNDVYCNDVWRSTDNGTTWTEMNSSAGWSARSSHSSVVLPDGSIVLMGGYDNNVRVDDVWRSTDNGATWTEMNSSAGWSARDRHSSVVLPDGSIVLMGGYDDNVGRVNDVWRSTDNGATWTEVNSSAGWSARRLFSSVALPDGSIVLMGGSDDNVGRVNDIWRSTDNGTTWTEVNSGADWTGRYSHSSVVLPDGSIVLMGGSDDSVGRVNDVWRLTTSGSSEQNPAHTYTEGGTYQVALKAYNAEEHNSTIETNYITVNGSINNAPTTPGAFTAPTSGQIKRGGLSFSVTWGASTDPDDDAVKYDLWFFNGSWTQIGSMLSTNSKAFTLPADNTDSAMFRVYANDTQDNSSARDVTFTIDSLKPVITYGTNGNLTYSQSHSTTVTASDALSGVQGLAYAWTQSDDTDLVSQWTSFTNGATLTKDSADGDWYLHIRATDNAGNIKYAVSSKFRLDNTAPEYTWIQKPLNADTGDSVVIELDVTDLSSISEYTITVDGEEHQMDTDSGNYLWTVDIPASDSGTLVSQVIYSCTFSDLAGNVDSTGNILLNVSILPIADFSASAIRGNAPLTVSFEDGSSGRVEDWYWDFGDGSTSTQQNPVHTFGSGNFTVNLTVENSNGTSSQMLNIKAAETLSCTTYPENSDPISVYGEEENFSVTTNILSSFSWYIDGEPISGDGVTVSSNNEDSSTVSYCVIDTSEYIDQDDFFVDDYNVSVVVSNESTGLSDTFSWDWTVTDSSAEDGDDIEFIISDTPDITPSGNMSYIGFNTTDDERTDNEDLTGSITFVSFTTPDNASSLRIKVEILDKSSLNESEAGFDQDSVYQYIDISFNNQTLVDDTGLNRSIEFRVLNERDGGTLVITSVMLKHWGNPAWETYTPELLSNDGTYSYFIVRNITGFSPFAITASYESSSSSGSNTGKASISSGSSYSGAGTTTTTPAGSEDTKVSDNTGSSTGEAPVSGEKVQTNDGIGVTDNTDSGKDDTGGSGGNIAITGILLLVAGLIIFFVWKKKEEEK